jgi:hypothetical protein
LSALSDEIRNALAPVFDDLLTKIDLRVTERLREEFARAAPQVDPEEELWGVARVAKALGKTTDAVHRANERGTLGIEPVRIGKRSLRWRAGDVRVLAAGKKGGR